VIGIGPRVGADRNDHLEPATIAEHAGRFRKDVLDVGHVFEDVVHHEPVDASVSIGHVSVRSNWWSASAYRSTVSVARVRIVTGAQIEHALGHGRSPPSVAA